MFDTCVDLFVARVIVFYFNFLYGWQLVRAFKMQNQITFVKFIFIPK